MSMECVHTREEVKNSATINICSQQKKAKVEEGLKTEGSEHVQPAELVKPKGSCMQSLPTMPWNFGGTSQFTINFNFTG